MLIVDDSKINRDILVSQTEHLAMHPTAVASGREALDLLCQGASFELAILDHRMPDMDGLTLAEAIQEIPAAQPMPLVLSTSLGYRPSDADSDRFSARLTKPVKASRLREVLCAVIDDGAASEKKHPAAPTLGDRELVERRPLRILLAEDNPVNQKVARKMLVKLGYRADVAANGLEVLEALKHIPYDVVLMDCQMPEMDGYEATREIRLRQQGGQLKPVRIIAMTASALQGDRERCLVVGMDDYLSKPVRAAMLQEVLKRCRPVRLSDDRVAGADPPKLQLEQVPVACPGAAGILQPVAAEPEEPPLDRESLDEISAADPEGVRELIELYLQQAEDTMTRLQAAIDAGVAQDVDRLAHKLTGSSAVCGVTVMLAPLRALEQRGREDRLSDANELLAQVRQRFAVGRRCLAEYLQESATTCDVS